MPSNKPKLSVILPAYNAEKYITEAIDSILNQTFKDFELLIADDGSTDKTKKIINSFTDNRIICVHNKKNLGKTLTVNSIFQLCRGDYVTIHDADDISLPNRFKVQVNFLDKHKNTLMCGTWFNYVKEDLSFFKICRTPTDYQEILSQISTRSTFHGPTVVYRKSVLKKLNIQLRPFFKDYNEDCDLNYRIVELGHCTNVNQVLYLYRLLPNSLSKALNPRKRVMYKIVNYLASQRKKYGKDDLDIGNVEKTEDFLKALTKKYTKDHTLILREQAEFYMYWEMNWNAIKVSFKALCREPFRVINFRTLQYCIRKTIFKI